jgi:hypothetical protein
MKQGAACAQAHLAVKMVSNQEEQILDSITVTNTQSITQRSATAKQDKTDSTMMTNTANQPNEPRRIWRIATAPDDQSETNLEHREVSGRTGPV